MGKETKTNAMRILERAKVAYTAHEYPHEEGVAVDGVTVAASIGEERVTLEDVCEPYLLQEGFLARTPRGRVATEKAYNHFGLPMPKRMQEQNQQETLFINEEGEETTINEDK